MAEWKIYSHVSKRSAASTETFRFFRSLNFLPSVTQVDTGLTKNLVFGLGD